MRVGVDATLPGPTGEGTDSVLEPSGCIATRAGGSSITNDEAAKLWQPASAIHVNGVK